MIIGNVLASLRKSRNLSEKELAKGLDYPEHLIIDFEDGTVMPGTDALRDYSLYFDVDLNYLYFFSTLLEKSIHGKISDFKMFIMDAVATSIGDFKSLIKEDIEKAGLNRSNFLEILEEAKSLHDNMLKIRQDILKRIEATKDMVGIAFDNIKDAESRIKKYDPIQKCCCKCNCD